MPPKRGQSVNTAVGNFIIQIEEGGGIVTVKTISHKKWENSIEAYNNVVPLMFCRN